ncbi:MAG: GNAT family N-acetyltransferase [Thermoanaerobaculia bacterium]
MVSLPSSGASEIRVLDADEQDLALEFLQLDPLNNVYFISRIQDEGVGLRGQTVAVLAGGEIVVLASLTTNVVLAGRENLSAELREEATALIAGRILGRSLPVRAMISDARLVDALWRRLEKRISPPTVVRLRQPVYAIPRGPTALPDLERLRYAVESDLASLVPACAAMHVEEVGISPLDRDAVGYRNRIRELIQRRRSFVLVENREIIFKAELSAVTDDAVQVMGVWTRPARRREGYARVGMAELAGHTLRQGKAITLFVNDFNHPAIRLYEDLGFRRMGENRALIW